MCIPWLGVWPTRPLGGCLSPQQRIPGTCISSSSSSDDLFESTKYSRDIIEEKLRGVALEKKQGEENSNEFEDKNQKGKTKSKKKSKCYCRGKKNHRSYHSKCSRRILPKTDGKYSVPTTSKDSAFRDDSRTECGGSKGSSALSFSIRDNESEAGSQYQIPQDSKWKDRDSIGNLVDGQSDKSSSSDEEILKRPCDRDTCPSLNKNLPGEVDVTESQKLCRASGEITKSGKLKDVEKLKSERSVLGEPTQSSMRLKSGVPSDVESSILSVRPAEFCTQETCEFARNQMQKQNVDFFKHFNTSKSEHFYNIAKKKEICSPKTCKLSGRRYKKLFSARARKLKGRMKINRWKRKNRNFICDCHNVYVGNDDSDSDDLWSDKGLRRRGNRRYCLTMDHLKNQAIKKCGGYMTEGHRCNCYSCYIKGKPWKEFLKMPNVVLDIPYPLTTNALKLRAQNTNLLSKKLSNKYNWSEENLKNFCIRHEVCKKPNLRKSILQENPFTSEWRWCRKNKVGKKVIKKEVPKEDNNGRFGYYVKIKEERLTRGEHFTNIQKVIEKAVFCRWNLDAAEMKLNHFLENMPKQQTCYSKVKTFDSDRRTCYNPKLVERLADMVNFNDEPDRKIHEFSFPPKLLKYQEPQLVGDIGTDMPEIRPVLESLKFPTIYRDLFKDQKRDLRKMMDTLLPPLQWTDNAGLWEMKVSIEPDNDETNNGMIKYLDFNETLCHAINKNFCAGRYRLYFEVFAEVIRQELIDNPERASLLARIREEFLLTLLLYDGGLEMTLVGTTHLWKDIEADTTDIIEKETLEKEIEELQGQIKGVVAATYDLEKRVEEQSQTRDYQFKDQEKLFKRTNHQLAAQFENITAGLLYDLD
uniref:33 kDa inner dynein arm light chain, axonemal n=1 Tax=Lygus hesperus TaxID=30085 RepID=A0A0A9Y8K7_LYGHE